MHFRAVSSHRCVLMYRKKKASNNDGDGNVVFDTRLDEAIPVTGDNSRNARIAALSLSYTLLGDFGSSTIGTRPFSSSRLCFLVDLPFRKLSLTTLYSLINRSLAFKLNGIIKHTISSRILQKKIYIYICAERNFYSPIIMELTLLFQLSPGGTIQIGLREIL